MTKSIVRRARVGARGRGWLGVALVLAACVNEPVGPSPALPPPAPPPPAPPPPAPTPATGAIILAVSTAGVDIDYNGYIPWVDGRQADPVAANGAVTIAGLAVGPHLVRLEGLVMNCVLDGPNGRSVDVTAGGTVTVSFAVSCVQNGKLAFVGGVHSNIYVINVDGTGSSPVTNSQWHAEPAWSPDGSRIAFSRYVDREGHDIFVMDWDGSDVVRLTNTRHTDRSPAWSPDGARIAFVSERDSGKAEIYIMKADGTNAVRVTRDAELDADPAWSPDGSKIAFSRNGKIYAMNSDGSGMTRLSPDDGKDSQPAWSPDGSTIAFSREAASGNSAIFTMQRDGSEPTRVTSDFIYAGSPTWSKYGWLALETIAECHPVPWEGDECTGEILIVRPDKTTYYVTSIGIAREPAWRP